MCTPFETQKRSPLVEFRYIKPAMVVPPTVKACTIPTVLVDMTGRQNRSRLTQMLWSASARRVWVEESIPHERSDTHSIL